VVHLGIVLVAVAVATSQAGTLDAEKTLAPGETLSAGSYTLELQAVRSVAEPQRTSIVADLMVSGNGASQTLHPALVQYPNSQAAVGSPGIGVGLGDDLYTILASYDPKAPASATIRVRVIPLVSWLWVGGLVVGIGAVIAGLPTPRRRSSVGVAVAEAPAPAD
jgi:cytochrome c-type biogenesis protein CcmF